MATKLNNLLKFTEYDHLQPKQKPTAKTEIGGFAVLEKKTVEELLALAAEKSGKSEKKLKKLTPKKLKKLAGIKKDKNTVEDEGGTIIKPKKEEPKEKEKEEKKDESLVTEKKASPAQLAARKKFAEMIAGKKKDKDEKGDKKGTGDEEGKSKLKRLYKPSPEKSDQKGKAFTSESLVLEASAKQKAARARFMEMINKKKGKKEDKKCKDGKHCDVK